MMAFCFRKTYVLAILLTEKKKKSKKKKVLGKKAEDLEILTYCHRNWNFSIADILLILFAWLHKYHCLSTCFYLYFYHGMLELLHHTSINYFVLQLLFVPSLLFPFFNLVFFYNEVYLKWSEMKSILFSFSNNYDVMLSLSNILIHSNSCDVIRLTTTKYKYFKLKNILNFSIYLAKLIRKNRIFQMDITFMFKVWKS